MKKEQQKVWLITGASRGFGRIWTEAALERGDLVAATARNPDSIADLRNKYGDAVLTLELDVTKPDQVKSAVAQAHQYFGRLDVVVNNAGYALVGTIEEAPLDDVRAQYETNVFGAVSVLQAVLPFLRAQGSGHIVGISSNLGQFVLPVIGYYASTKWAFEAIHESLAAETKAFGIKVSIVEPGAYATEFGSPASLKSADGLAVYDDFKKSFLETLKTFERGNPAATPKALFKLVDADEPPLRFFLGDNLSHIEGVFQSRIDDWKKWQSVSAAAQEVGSNQLSPLVSGN